MLKTIPQMTQSVVEATLNFVFPPTCIFCSEYYQKRDVLVCENCWSSLPTCEAREAAQFKPISKCVSLWLYSDNVESLIHEVKFFRKLALGRRIANEVGRLVEQDALFVSADLIVPVPLHKARFRERGYNQSEVFSREIGSLIGVESNSTILQRARRTQSQAKLNAAERRENMVGAFRTSKEHLVSGKRVIVVDDVVTTGSTLIGCAEALLDSGATEVLALTAALTPLSYD